MKNSIKRLEEIKSQIESVTETLADLSLEIDQLIEEEVRTDRKETVEAKAETKPSKQRVIAKGYIKNNIGPPFAIGERVIITNNYKGLKGTEGVVTGHSARGKYTYIEDDSGNSRRKENHNLRRVA